MPYCSQCGKLLSDEDEYCSKCGLPVSEDRNITFGNSDTGAMSVEESIALVKEMSSKFEAINKLKTSISDCEAEIEKLRPSANKVRYSAFRFFWPFLIISLVAYWVIVLIGCIVSVKTDDISGIYISEFAGFIVIAVILIAGGLNSQKKRDFLNFTVREEESIRKKKYDEKQKEIELLKNSLKDLKASAAKYDRLVPFRMRHKSKMDIVIDLLENGRAKTIEEAVEICKNIK